MYARSECLREGTALACGEREMRNSRNGARMGLSRMPTACFILAAHLDRFTDRDGRSDWQRAAYLSQTKHRVQRNRQTGANHINQQASFKRKCLPDVSLQFKQSCPTSMRAIRSQLRCNPDSHVDDAYTSFHRFCNLARRVETPLCRMCFLFLHAHRICNRCETIIYSK